MKIYKGSRLVWIIDANMNKILKNILIALGVIILWYITLSIYSAYKFSQANIQEWDLSFQYLQSDDVNKNP